MYTHAHIIPIANPIPAAAAESLRIAVVARDRLSRAGLVALLGAFDDLIVEELDVDDFLASRIRVMRPDALLADGDAGDLRNLEAAGVVLLDDPSLAAETLANGARGILMRDASPQRIRAALIAASEGIIVIDDALAGAVLQQSRRAHELIEPLTARELEVMQLLASGQTNKEIAHRLGVTEHTVKFHVNSILGKLGVATRTEAVVHAARLGIVML
ncbi:MAG TPA: response regulator transcription factor [Thermoanaerobaculia bacterium]|nr:response regulator transcription factor [Thermoanaerobaculia bacterium]